MSAGGGVAGRLRSVLLAERFLKMGVEATSMVMDGKGRALVGSTVV